VVPHEHPVPARLLGLGAQAGDERGVGKLVEKRDVEAGAQLEEYERSHGIGGAVRLRAATAGAVTR
jgi:hypothetical protein